MMSNIGKKIIRHRNTAAVYLTFSDRQTCCLQDGMDLSLCVYPFEHCMTLPYIIHRLLRICFANPALP